MINLKLADIHIYRAMNNKKNMKQLPIYFNITCISLYMYYYNNFSIVYFNVHCSCNVYSMFSLNNLFIEMSN